MASGTGAARMRRSVLSSGLSSLSSLWVFSSVLVLDLESSVSMSYSLILGAACPNRNRRLVPLHWR